MNAQSFKTDSKLAELCRKYRVKRLTLFGSSLREDFDPVRSDIDLSVEFLSMSPTDHARAYFGLLFALESLLKRPVDLVEFSAVKNPYIRREIETTEEAVYAA